MPPKAKTTTPKKTTPAAKTPRTKAVKAAPVTQAPPAEKKPRRPLSLETLTEAFAELTALLDGEIERLSKSKEKGSAVFRRIRRHVTGLQKKSTALAKRKHKRSGGHNGGFKTEHAISKDLADFLKVKPDTRVNRQDVTQAICVYARLRDDENRPSMLKWKHLNPKGRNLQDPENKKALLPDKALASLLNYDQYKKDVAAGTVTKKVKREDGSSSEEVVTDPALYYYVVQKLVQRHFV